MPKLTTPRVGEGIFERKKEMPKKSEIETLFFNLIENLQREKGEGRSPTARRYAIVITMLEKAYAYFMTFIK